VIYLGLDLVTGISSATYVPDSGSLKTVLSVFDWEITMAVRAERFDLEEGAVDSIVTIACSYLGPLSLEGF
jgi:hypothetical protein